MRTGRRKTSTTNFLNSSSSNPPLRRRRVTERLEWLERRELLAGDLIGQWRADDLAGQFADGAAVTSWADATQGTVATAQGTPKFVQKSLGGRAAIRFDPSDGDDLFEITAANNPLSNANDFSVVLVFATASNSLVGENGPWFDNTGLVDSSSLGFAQDWGLSINRAGQISAGMGAGFGGPPPLTAYSTTTGLNDGQAHVVTVARSGSQLSITVDDAPAVTQDGFSSSPRSRVILSIGRLLSDKLPFAGEIAELRMYNGALSGAEVTSLTDTLQAYYGNSAPVPVDDHYATDEDATFFLIPTPGVLTNDVDADGDPLKARVETTTMHGSLALQPNGSFFYTPAANFYGSDSFTYRAVDFRDSLTVGTVNIEVRPKYDAAVAVSDSYKTLPGQTLTVSATEGVLANDTNIDLSPLTAVLQDNVSEGTLNLHPDGSFTYHSGGFAGTATFSYRINDQTQLSPPVTVNLIVNTPPVGQADSYVVNEDVRYDDPLGVTANDIDAEGTPLTVSLVAGPEHGQLNINPDGSFSFIPELNYVGSDLFTYQVTDGIDASPPVSVQLDIRPVNDAPISASNFYVALPGETLRVSAATGVLANDQDVELAPLTARLVQPPQHGALTLNADGSFSYAANPAYLGSDSFTYQADDGQDLSAVTSVSLTVTAQPVIISELMASNAETLTTMLRSVPTDEFVGETFTFDWIEVHNVLTQPLDLSGFHLTDDPTNLNQWAFPAGTVVAPNGYLVVFASGRNLIDPALDQLGYLHTNFQLSTDPDYLALTAADGTVVHELGSVYPPQRTHITYGFDAQGNSRYFTTPTPAAANGDGLQGLVADTRFSVDRGFYDAPFQVEISSVTPGALIRYTTNGSLPDESTGVLYTGPITIDSTTTLRARAFLDGWVATNADTTSYFFVNDVVNQTPAATLAAGFPAKWRTTNPDYGLDSENQFPQIAGDTSMSVDAAKDVIKDSLLSLPTMSIVMNIDDMFGTRGIYANPESSGKQWERATSVELVHPDGTEGFQIDSGIRIQGGAFRGFGLTPKKSFRLLFKTKFGPGQLEYPLFGADGAVDQFQTLTLRMESNDGWQWGDAGGQPQYARDEFHRRTQLAMGQPAPHGRNIHLYINGFYWGMYNIVERPDESFGAAYFGADPYTWDGQNSGTAINAEGDPYRGRRARDAWTSLTTMTRAIRQATTEEEKTARYLAVLGLNPDGTDNPEMAKWIDPINYSDYLITNYYGGNADWPFKNYYFGRENSPDSDGFKFFLWDAEWSLLLRSKTGQDLINDSSGAAAPFRDLRTSQEFRTLFGDRVHKHLFNGGALYVDPANPAWDAAHPERNIPAARYVELADEIRDGLIAESARYCRIRALGRSASRDALYARCRVAARVRPHHEHVVSQTDLRFAEAL